MTRNDVPFCISPGNGRVETASDQKTPAGEDVRAHNTDAAGVTESSMFTFTAIGISPFDSGIGIRPATGTRQGGCGE